MSSLGYELGKEAMMRNIRYAQRNSAPSANLEGTSLGRALGKSQASPYDTPGVYAKVIGDPYGTFLAGPPEVVARKPLKHVGTPSVSTGPQSILRDDYNPNQVMTAKMPRKPNPDPFHVVTEILNRPRTGSVRNQARQGIK